MARLNLTDRKWNWIDDGLLAYALAAMRAIWVWLLLHIWSEGLVQNPSDLISPFVVFCLLALSTLAAQYSSIRGREGWRGSLTVTFGGLAAVILTVYLVFGVGRAPIWDPGWLAGLGQNVASSVIVLVVAVWLWRSGILAGREPQTFDDFSRAFAIGVIVFALALGFAYATDLLPLTELIIPLLLFFGIGLGALAIANLQDERKYERARTGESFTLNRYWLGTVGAVILFLLLSGLVLGQLFAPGIASEILALAGAVLGILTRVLLFFVLIFAFVVFTLFDLIAGILRLQPGANNQPAAPQAPNIGEQFKDLSQPTAVSPELFLILQVAAGILLAVVALAIFALAFRRFRMLAEEDVPETRDTIFSVDLIRQQLAELFGRRGKEREKAVEPYAAIIGDDPRARIRRAYQALLIWAASRGVRRSPGMTPNEYLQLMDRALHIYIEPIWTITEAYLGARYGNGTIPVAMADEAVRAWEQIARENGNKQ